MWFHFGKYVFPLQVRQFSTATKMFIYPKLCQPEHSGLSCQNPYTDCLLQSLVHKLLWIMFSNTMNPAAQLTWGQHCLRSPLQETVAMKMTVKCNSHTVHRTKLDFHFHGHGHGPGHGMPVKTRSMCLQSVWTFGTCQNAVWV